jgi:hypothetical protein
VINSRSDDVTRQWSVRLVAGLAVVAALLSGCSEKQPANETLPSASPAETTPELPPLGPEDMPMPDEARTQDAAGAEAFVRYYIELINRTGTTLDAAPLRNFSDGCDDCDRIASNAEANAEAGNRYEGGHITIVEVAPALVEGTSGDMAIRIDQSALVIVDPSGVPVHEGGSEAYTGLPGSVAVEWDSDRESWLMTYMAFG